VEVEAAARTTRPCATTAAYRRGRFGGAHGDQARGWRSIRNEPPGSIRAEPPGAGRRCSARSSSGRCGRAELMTSDKQQLGDR
jgi:hypothetical protein